MVKYLVVIRKNFHQKLEVKFMTAVSVNMSNMKLIWKLIIV